MAVLVVRKIVATSASVGAATSSGDVAPGAPCKPRRVSMNASGSGNPAEGVRTVRPTTTPFQPTASNIATTSKSSLASRSALERRRASTSQLSTSSQAQSIRRAASTSAIRHSLVMYRTYTPPLLLPYDPADPFTLPTRRQPRRMSGTYDSEASEFLPGSGSSSPGSARSSRAKKPAKRRPTAVRNEESKKTVLGKRKRVASRVAVTTELDSEEETDYDEVPKPNAAAVRVKDNIKSAVYSPTSRTSSPPPHPAKRRASAPAPNGRNEQRTAPVTKTGNTTTNRSRVQHASPPSSDENDNSGRAQPSRRQKMVTTSRLSGSSRANSHKPSSRKPFKPVNTRRLSAQTKPSHIEAKYDESSDPLDFLS